MTDYVRGLAHEPVLKPERPFFSSGPTAKFPGWSLDKLKTESLGRSHRSSLGKARLKYALDLSRELLGIPDDYLIGIMPASDTGAIEAAMWSMLDPARPVTVAAWESFGNVWIQDAVKQLKLPNLQVLTADYGAIPDLTTIPQRNDVVFTWNGTTSGVRVPDADWIADDREGLAICDATSAAFAMPLPFDKLDVVTFSFQKALGGEAVRVVVLRVEDERVAAHQHEVVDELLRRHVQPALQPPPHRLEVDGVGDDRPVRRLRLLVHRIVSNKRELRR